MKRKGLKILCGILATLSVLGATCSIVGALSDGFNNWDPNTWFNDKDTEDKIGGVVSVDEENKIQPVLFKVNNLAATEDSGVIDMSNVVITATTDGSIEPCDKFIFSFSEDVNSYCTYETTDNTITINFTEKPTHCIYLYANTTGSAVVHRGTLKIDFTKNLLSVSLNGLDDTGVIVGEKNEYLSLDLFTLIEENVEYLNFENALIFNNNYGTIDEPVSMTYSFDSEYDIFVDNFDGKKLYFDLNESLIEQIYLNPEFQGEGSVLLGNLIIHATGDVSGFDRELATEIRIPKKNVVDGGVDMGGDIIVG